jgi:ankyrin repeat protein
LHTPSRETAKLLLERGADASRVAKNGDTAMSFAIAKGGGQVEIVDLLLARGANPNVTRPDGLTAAMVMAWAPAALEALANKGADLKALDPQGRTALLRAANQEGPDTVRVLLKYGSDVKATDPAGNNALHSAAKLGRSDIIGDLLRAGVPLNARNNAGVTPLGMAIMAKCAGVVKSLREVGGTI